MKALMAVSDPAVAARHLLVLQRPLLLGLSICFSFECSVLLCGGSRFLKLGIAMAARGQ